MNGSPIHISISVGTFLKILGLGVLAVALYIVRDLVLVVLTAVVIASAIEPSIVWLRRYRVSRLPAVLMMYALGALVIFVILFFFFPPIINEVYRLSVDLPELLRTIDLTTIIPGDIGLSLTEFFRNLFANFSASTYLSELSGSTGSGFLGAARYFFDGLVALILVIVISFYFAVQERGIDNFLRVVVPVRHERYVIDLWQRSQKKIGRWMQGQLVLALMIGVLVFLGLSLIQVKYALVLALLAAVFEIIPIFGPILAAVPAVILAFATGITPGFTVLGFYIIIQQFENHLFYPLVVTKIVGVPPLLVILAIAAGWKLLGIFGVILAIPAAAIAIEVFQDVMRGKKFGDQQPQVEIAREVTHA